MESLKFVALFLDEVGDQTNSLFATIGADHDLPVHHHFRVVTDDLVLSIEHSIVRGL